MPLPEDIGPEAQLLLLAYCHARIPASVRHEYRLAIRTRMNTMTLYEVYGPWNPKFPKSSRTSVAQFRYDPEHHLWTLYWADEQEKWHRYDQQEPTPDLLRLIQAVDEDPAGVFFG